MDYKCCQICPRLCRVDRTRATGFCKSTDTVMAARAALHHWEEPCISGTQGSGTLFFSGCTLQCCYCQNHPISSGEVGKAVSVNQLADLCLKLQDQGAHNINLVTPTHYLPSILKALDLVKHRLSIPVVYNSSGYERVQTIQELKGYIDIYLPDLKYKDSQLSKQYSHAADYFDAASTAIPAMAEQTGPPVFLENGILKKGVVLRHMVLPGHRDDSIALLKWTKENMPKDSFLISLLSQYTPFYQSCLYPGINRKLTSYEYGKVVEAAWKLGLDAGYMQKKSSAKEEYTPLFNLEGLPDL